MTEESGTGSHERDAVALPAGVSSPPPHPVRKSIVIRRSPITMTVKRRGMRAISVILVSGKENLSLVKAVMCISSKRMEINIDIRYMN